MPTSGFNRPQICTRTTDESSAVVTKMNAAVILCVVGLTLAEANRFTFPGSFGWNGPGSGGGSETDPATAKDIPASTGTGSTISDVCQTDQAACGCCLMHQQIDRMKRNFNQSLVALQSELNKAVDTLSLFRSTRSAFSVSLFTSDTQKCYGPFRDDTPIIYEHIFLNMGDHYDANTGVFTVPRTGVYSLALTIYSDAGGPGNTLAACGSLRVNGRLLTGPREFNMQDQEDSASNSLVVKLKTGDKVSVNLPIGCFLCDNSNHYNTFSGFLLYITD
ncbi:uncharacterized protein [Eucyclogobius newberryi]|uniref:uncharacterized protein n=1 Tax=Eucyclogobius newberryi TaxID=166745 RepID=UPI003B5947DA